MQDCSGVIRVYQRSREFCSKAQKKGNIYYMGMFIVAWYGTLR